MATNTPRGRPPPQDVLPQLFQQLNICTGTDDYVRSRRLADQILKQDPSQWDAFYTKLVCFVHESNFEAVLRNISSHKFGDRTRELAFIHAYTLYRLNRHQEALTTLSKSETGIRELELRAQILYKMEQYAESAGVYQREISHLEEIDSDRLVNQLAALSLSSPPPTTDTPIRTETLETYEQLYNYSSYLLSNGSAHLALDYLERAESTAVSEMTNDPDYSTEELEDEMSAIRVQKAFALQCLGRSQEASKIYSRIIKQKVSDHSVSAVASNNIVSINKEKDVFDSRKRIKASSSDVALKKMTSQQRSTIHFNKCLLAINTNQLAQAKSGLEMVKKMQKNGQDLALLLELAIQYKLGEIGASKQSLLDILSSHPNSPAIVLTLSQIALSSGQFELSCEIVCSCPPLCFTPGIVSFVVSLYAKLRRYDKIDEVLVNAINHWTSLKESDPKAVEYIKKYVCHAANYKLLQNCYVEAAEFLEKYRDFFQEDRVYLHLLINTYAAIDITKAEKVLSGLKQEEVKTVDVEELEKVQNLRQVITKKTPLLDKIGKKDEKSRKEIKPKRKKKKKGKLPQNYNPNSPPDAERWLPLKERSYYKKMKKKGGLGRRHYGKYAQQQPVEADKPKSSQSVSHKKKPKGKKKNKRW